MVQHEFAWVTRWVIASSNPFISTSARLEIDANFQALAAANPEWFAAWSSGLLSDVVATFDDADPWLRLTLDGGRALHPDGSPFGSWVDCADLCPPNSDDPSLDLGLAPVAEPLSDKAAAMMAIAGKGWAATLEWAKANLVDGYTTTDDAFESVTSALRYAYFRRSMYAGLDDHFNSMAGTAWVSRALNIVAGKPWDEAGAARFRHESKADEGQYLELT